MNQGLSIQEVDALTEEAFMDRLGWLFEGSPWIVREAWHDHPFGTRDRLYRSLISVMEGADRQRQIALIKAHPDLVGKAALDGTLSPQSTGEQASAGLDDLTPDDVRLFQEFNEAYWARFGFPFVICARENKKDSILAGFQSRLSHAKDQEIMAALDEIAKIVRLRLEDAVW